MAFSPQTNRAIRLLTVVATTGTAFHCVFRIDYGDEPHVFTGLQAWYNSVIDGMMGIDDDVIREAREERRRVGRLGGDRKKNEEDGDGDAATTAAAALKRDGSGGSLTEKIAARER